MFFLALSGISIYYNSGIFLTVTTLIFAFAFGVLVKIHHRVKHHKNHCDLLVGINRDELKRLELDLHSFEEGIEYIEEDHPYCVDLDLFGSHSIFQWLNRTVTRGGEQLLAKELLYPPDLTQVKQRQPAIDELSADPNWAQQFQAGALAHKGHNADIKTFIDWVIKPTNLPGWFRLAIFTLPLIAVGLTTAYFMGMLSGYLVLIPLTVNGLLLSRVQPLAQDTYNQTHRSINTLKAYEAMINCIENSDFRSGLLVELRKSFLDKNEKASVTILQLKNILSRIEVRNNFLYWLFNAYFLLDLIWLIQSERWKSQHSEYVVRWFDSIRQYELLISLSSSAYSHPHFVFPSWVEHSYYFKAGALGHPLIPEKERVTNDFSLEKKGSVVILTGSNMSGKSTYLRTLGVNIVLAKLGASVCAKDLQLGTFNLFTSMRTTDSLEQHVSSFYAELERIRQLIGLLEEKKPTLFLLDELLKGTNSHDRNLGSAALVKQLSNATAFGLISTHDLALGELSNGGGNIVNLSFNSRLSNGKLTFDYKLRPGLCNSFNATDLMEQMGINLQSEQPQP